MESSEVVSLLRGLPGVVVQEPAPGSDAPEIAWGDAFAFADGAARMPFATVVTKDYPEDAASRLDRPDAFRVNVDVGRRRFVELVDYVPGEHAAHADGWDYSAADVVVPHPIYASAGWVSVTCPSRLAVVEPLVREAHERAVGRTRGGRS